MKTVEICAGGGVCRLLFNGYAMCAINELCGGAAQLFEQIQGTGEKELGLLCRAFAVMAEQGELCRRSMGYDPEELITAEQLLPRIMPGDIPVMRRAVYAAIMLGYGREVESNDDVDLVLQELQLKKKKR